MSEQALRMNARARLAIAESMKMRRDAASAQARLSGERSDPRRWL
jgi:hypothetical protein